MFDIALNLVIDLCRNSYMLIPSYGTYIPGVACSPTLYTNIGYITCDFSQWSTLLVSERNIKIY